MKNYINFEKLNRDHPYFEQKKENYLSIKHHYDQSDHYLNSYPARITLQTTEQCNLNCIMCANRRHDVNLLHMNKKFFIKIAQELFPYLVELHPTNIGEPLCSPWFSFLCDTMAHYGVLLDLTTNGTLLNRQNIAQILPILADIKISFDSVKKDTLERIRRGANFETLCSNIQLISEMREEQSYANHPSITLQTTLMRKNFQELPEIIRFAHEKGLDRVKAFHLFSYSEKMDSECVDLEDYDEIHKKAISLGKKLNIHLELAEPSHNFDLKDLIPRACPLLWVESFIDVDGSVYPCHSHGGDSIGNLNGSNFKDLWNSPFYQDLRLKIKIKTPIWHCKGCGMLYEKIFKNQAISYDFNNFKSIHSYKTDGIRWSSRMKQFDNRREYIDKMDKL